MAKYYGKRFIVFGRGMGEEYYIEHDTMRKARLEAWAFLNDSYSANILDQKTDKVIEIRFKK